MSLCLNVGVENCYFQSSITLKRSLLFPLKMTATTKQPSGMGLGRGSLGGFGNLVTGRFPRDKFGSHRAGRHNPIKDTESVTRYCIYSPCISKLSSACKKYLLLKIGVLDDGRSTTQVSVIYTED